MPFYKSVSFCTSVLFIVLLAVCTRADAQPQLQVPQPSPAAAVTQTIGVASVSVTYHRPSVNKRTIWGELVPYNDVWRAGANENTTIAFSDPVKIEGQDLPAGTYGLHMIPTQNAWTVIFSKNSSSWGSFFYNQAEDALRVTVQPQQSDFQEQLRYVFGDVKDVSAVLALEWEKLHVPIRLDFDTKALVLAHARNTYLRGPAGFTWEGFNQAAGYCDQNNMDLDEGLVWIDKSIGINENVRNLYVKAGLLDKLGKPADAQAARDRAMKVAATEADLNILGYYLLAAGKKKEAIDIFKKNVRQYPDSWNVYDSLGEAQAADGDAKAAIDNYTKALSMVKDDANKKRITGVLTKLQGK